MTRVGFDSSGLVVYAFAGVGIKMPRSSGEQYKVGQKVLPSQALPGDLIFYGPEGSQSVALFIGNGQMVEATDPAVTVSPVRTDGHDAIPDANHRLTQPGQPSEGGLLDQILRIMAIR